MYRTAWKSVWESSNVPRSIPIYQMCHCFLGGEISVPQFVEVSLGVLKPTVRTWKDGETPKRKVHLPTIHFQVRTVGFRAGIYVCQLARNMDIASFFCELKQGSVKHILLVRIVNRRQFGSSPPGKKKGQRQTCVFPALPKEWWSKFQAHL